MNHPELMSPAGSFESLQAALKAGADSIYFGVEQLNMRAKAGNTFTLDDLGAIRKLCAARKVKTYLTLNTVMYDHDMTLMKKIVNEAKKAKIDAVIACDQAVLSYAKRAGMPLHISTQANVSNIESVMFYADYADAVVLARELSLRQVAEITKQVKRKKIKGPSGELMKIEVFAHGALCMAISGKCYLSLHANYSSANRGACVQNCRRSYIVKDKEQDIEFEVDNEYIMSAKDLCTIDFMDKLLAAGVNILKIEGRGRSADYVDVTTRCYRKAIDAVREGTFTAEKVAAWKERLSTVFNRGFWGGYYLGQKMGEWSDEAGSKATRRKVYIGKGVKYYPKNQVAEFRMEAGQLTLGQRILITGPGTGVLEAQVAEMRVENTPVEFAQKGENVSFPLKEKIRASDKLYKLVDANDKDYAAAQ